MMKHITLTFFAAALALLPAAQAGTMLDPAEAGAGHPATAAPPPAEFFGTSRDDHWLEVRPYLWTVNMKGDLGINGIITPVDLSFGDIIDNLDLALAATIELRHKRWGLFFDGNYLKVSPTIDNVPVDLFDSVGINMKSFLMAIGVMYRVAEWDRGFLDIGAGAQYTWMDQTINFAPNNDAIRLRSEQLASTIVDGIVSAVRGQVAGLSPTPMPPPVAMPLPDSAVNGAVDRVLDRTDGGRLDVIRDNLNDNIVSNVRENFGDRIAGSGRVRDAIRNLVKAQVQQQLAAVRGAVTSKLRKAVEKAERALAKEIEKQITSSIPSNANLKVGWWDAFAAARLRHFFTDKFYLNAFGSVGGGSSDLVWQIGVGPGWQINDWLAMEFFYRRMSIDYSDGGFLYDVDLTGLFLGIAMEL